MLFRITKEKGKGFNLLNPQMRLHHASRAVHVAVYGLLCFHTKVYHYGLANRGIYF